MLLRKLEDANFEYRNEFKSLSYVLIIYLKFKKSFSILTRFLLLKLTNSTIHRALKFL